MSAPAAAAFDINSETNPFRVVQYLLDQAAYFNLLSVPAVGSIKTIESCGNTIGFEIGRSPSFLD